MNEAPPSMKTRAFLIFCAVGLVPIALGYGAKPSASLDMLFGITVDTTNLTHIMRAVMALSDRIVVIHFGNKIAEGTPREVASNENVIKAYLGAEYGVS